LGANQHLSVSAKTPCAQVSASVKHMFPAYQVAQAPIGAGVMPPPPASAPQIDNSARNMILGLAGTGVVLIGASGSSNNSPVSGQ
ncbi:MAG: hypothetical protein ACYC03_14300, partial [Acidovorax defluvii]